MKLCPIGILFIHSITFQQKEFNPQPQTGAGKSSLGVELIADGERAGTSGIPARTQTIDPDEDDCLECREGFDNLELMNEHLRRRHPTAFVSKVLSCKRFMRMNSDWDFLIAVGQETN